MWKGFSDVVGQFKYKGTNDQLTVFPDQRIEHWSRHRLNAEGKEDPKGKPKRLDYTLPAAMRDEILAFTPKGTFTIYNVELLHAKTTMVKNTVYFFDVLVYDGQHLLGVEYAERYNILAQKLGGRHMPNGQPRIDGLICMAENMAPSRWDAAYHESLGTPYCEGLFFKRTGASSRLTLGDRAKNNEGFSARARKPDKNFRY